MRTLSAFLILFAYAIGALAQDCRDPILNELEKLLAANRENSAIYCADQCYFNSGELARIVTQNFGEVDAKELHILIIKNEKASLYGETAMRHKIVGNGLRNGEEPWNYHAVLEYQGYILDLDLKESKAVPVRKYFEQVFPPKVAVTKPVAYAWGQIVGKKMGYGVVNFPSQLEIGRVPATAYFEATPFRPKTNVQMNKQMRIAVEPSLFQSLENFLGAYK
jgi:hypothetical protein